MRQITCISLCFGEGMEYFQEWTCRPNFLCFVKCIVIKLEPKPAASIQINYNTFVRYKISEEMSRTPHLK